ncbi:hypothetical protein [Steroidobacter cummioxidans]|uniref:hypothetical protein n=1 Tax=Steroidobacter cummioxidans TaxID=1803913 RepID=UPI000E30DF1B|nr:hypothetical protein [Steroidobacter cummioxidans]
MNYNKQPGGILFIMQRRCWALLLCGLAGLHFFNVAAAEGEMSTAGEAPLFIYSFTGNPKVSSGNLPWGTAMIAEGLASLGDMPNKPLVEKMKSELDQVDQKQRFQSSFGCLFSPCKQVQLLTKPPFQYMRASVIETSDEITGLLDHHKTGSVWVLDITEQFHVGGYNLSVRATEAYFDAAGVRQYRPLQVMYWDPYSARLDATSRGMATPDAKARPRFNTKEAKAAYWFGTSPTRLQSAMSAAPSGAADLLKLMIDLPRDSSLVSGREAFGKLPKLKELRSKKEASCTAAYCSTRVLQDLGERLYLEADWGMPWLISTPRWGL